MYWNFNKKVPLILKDWPFVGVLNTMLNLSF